MITASRRTAARTFADFQHSALTFLNERIVEDSGATTVKLGWIVTNGPAIGAKGH